MRAEDDNMANNERGAEFRRLSIFGQSREVLQARLRRMGA